MSSNLERRYRGLLRVLPAWYRAEREEEMVGIFMADRTDGLDLEHSWPGWGEAWATAALAVRVRFGARRRAGAVVRLVAMAGVVWHVVLAGQGAASALRFGGQWAPWFDGVVAVALFALVTGRWPVAKVAAGVLALYGVVAVAGAWPVVPWWLVAVQLPSWVMAAAVLLGFHREAPAVPRTRWVAAAATGLVLGAAWGLLVPLSPAALLVAAALTTGVVVVFRPWAGAVPEVAASRG